MESQSMRRRQTVLGDQLQLNASSSSQNLGVPSLNLPPPNGGGSSSSVGRHMRTFSHLSSRPPPPASSGPGGPNLGVKGGLGGPGDDGSAIADSSMSSLTGQSGGAGAGAGAGGDDEIDASLVSRTVDPAAYVARMLAGADPASILQFGEKLRMQAQRANDADQRSLQNSHKALTTVASNVSRLVPAVAELHRQVTDLSLVSDAMRQDAFSAQSGMGALGSGGGAGGAGAGGAGAGGAGSGSGGAGGGSSAASRRASMASFDGDGDGSLRPEDAVLSSGVPYDRRQSMLVLNSAWTNDLNDLFRRVDGAQRVLPPAPGRHVVLEESTWSEVNLVTQQPVRPVLLVVLNDFLLVAAPRQGRFAHAYHLPLDETLECTMDERAKVLRVARGSTQFGLLAPGLARLRVVYAEVFKHIELAGSRRRASNRAASKRAGIEASPGPSSGSAVSGSAGSGSGSGSGGSAGSGFGSSGGGIGSGGSSTTGFGGRSRSRSVQHNRRTSHSSISSMPEVSVEQRREAARIIADLDRKIVLREWSTATEECLAHDEDPVLGPLVAERRRKLTDHMLEELSDRRMALTRNDRSIVVQQLSKLGRAQEAKHALLAAAAADIEMQAREVHFMGDVVNYISQMAAIYFQTIIATLEVYRQAFPSKVDSSFLVAWVKSQVDLYAAIFNRQLFRIAPEFRAYQRCREVSREESSQLRKHNMDMEFMLRYVWED